MRSFIKQTALQLPIASRRVNQVITLEIAGAVMTPPQFNTSGLGQPPYFIRYLRTDNGYPRAGLEQRIDLARSDRAASHDQARFAFDLKEYRNKSHLPEGFYYSRAVEGERGCIPQQST